MAGKFDIRDKAKALWIRGMKVVGNTAANIANNTRYKVDEVTIQNRKREVLSDLARKTYALWLKGEPFPVEMEMMLEELKHLDEQLNDMRAEKYATCGKVEQATSAAIAETEEEKEEADDAQVISSPVTAEINELFDCETSVESSAERVNQSLEQLSNRLKEF